MSIFTHFNETNFRFIVSYPKFNTNFVINKSKAVNGFMTQRQVFWILADRVLRDEPLELSLAVGSHRQSGFPKRIPPILLYVQYAVFRNSGVHE